MIPRDDAAAPSDCVRPGNTNPNSPNEDVVDSFLRCRDGRPEWIGIPPGQRPRTLQEGYRIQAAVHRALERRGVRRVGYKIGSTSRAGQRAFGLLDPIYAGIFANTQCSSLAEALSARLMAPSVECEIAVKIGREIDGSDPAFADESVADAIEWCAIACEVIDDRYGAITKADVPTLLADDFYHANFVLGASVAGWRELDLSHLRAFIEINGAVASGCSEDVFTCVESVRWLASKLAAEQRTLRAGEIVLTGSLVSPTRLAGPLKSVCLSIEGFSPLRFSGSPCATEQH